MPRFMRVYYNDASVVFAGLPDDALRVEYNLVFLSGPAPVIDRFARFVQQNLRDRRRVGSPSPTPAACRIP